MTATATTRHARILVGSDPSRFDVDAIHRFLKESYWAKGVPRAVVERSIRGSLCFGVFDGRRQVGFARVITDRATFAYLADVFIVPSYRGRGLARRVMARIMAHPDLQGLRRWCLVTRDAHGLYRQFGFAPLGEPSRFMEIWDPGIYGCRPPSARRQGARRAAGEDPKRHRRHARARRR